MGNCCKPYADQVDSEGDSREMLAMDDGGNTRERLATCSDGISRERSSSTASSELRVERRSMLNRGEGSRRRDQISIDIQSSSMHGEQHAQHPSSGGIPRAKQGEQVAAGWPLWLTEVATEAIKGWIPRRLDSFENLVKIGQGTYSDVYRALDSETGKVVALKKVKFNNLDRQSIRFMAREIHILRRLHHPNIIKLEGVVTSRMSDTLYLVFEYMEHDLLGLASLPGLKFTEPQIKCYMKQLLRGIDCCHRRGILHRDIKGSNLLIDHDGILKIADFGLAKIYYRHQLEPMTNRVVTLWYRPPELLLGATCYGPAIDLWSIGCILAELYEGKPIMTGRTELEQLEKIFELCGSPSEEYWRKSDLPHAATFKPKKSYKRCIADRFKDLSAPALSLIETLLSIDPAARLSAAQALDSEFFSSNPLACEPEELPKYPPSKELDARVRDEEAVRQAKGRIKVERDDAEGEETSNSRAIPAPDANAESVLSMEKQSGQCNFRNEKFNPRQEESTSGFPIKPPRPGARDDVISGRESTLHQKTSHSGLLVRRAARDELGSGSKGHNICYSGPLIPPVGNVNQMLRDPDRLHVQEPSGHAHVDKGKQKRLQSEAILLPTNTLYIGPYNRPKK